MYTINTERVVKWPVHVHVPVDGGAHETHEFTAHFKLPDDEDAIRTLGDRATLREVVVGWDDVAIDSQGPLAFSAKALERLMRITYVRVALVGAYLDCKSGIKRKNSVTPPAIGLAAAETSSPATRPTTK